MATNTLLVVFHGSMAFFDPGKDGDISVALTDMQDDHEYVAGSFRNELAIPRNASLDLSNVDDGSAHFDGTVHCIFSGAKPSGSPYAQLTFPRPAAIDYLFQVSISGGSLSGITPNASGNEIFSFITVFEYTYDTGALPVLGDPMDPLWQARGNNGETLHIYAENPMPMGKQHVLDSFAATVLLLGENVAMNAAVLTVPVPKQRPFPDLLGGRCEEFEPLPLRTTPPQEYDCGDIVALLKKFFLNLNQDTDQHAKREGRKRPTPTDLTSDDPSCLNMGGTP